MGLLLCVALLVSIFSTLTVCRAEKHLFGRTGGDVRFDLQEYKGLQLESIIWTFDTQRILWYMTNTEALTTYEDYETRTEFDKGNLSLLLKNLRLTDSGIYTAKTSDIKGKEQVPITYRLTVQEATPKPQVEVALLSSAGGVCNVSVNCSVKDTRASYICDHIHCTLVQNKPTGLSLIVTATNWTIQCNSSNRVSTEVEKKSIKDICLPKKNSKKEPIDVIPFVVPVIIAVLLAIVGIIIIRKRRSRSEGTQVVTQNNTDYATVEGVRLQNLSPVETMYDVVTTAKPESPPQVNTVYDTLGPPGDNSAKPESIYATVNKSTA